jgi:hypothetical protein
MTGLALLAAATLAGAPLSDLNGEWRSVGERPIRVSYRSISNDLATVEQWRTPSGRETMTVYTVDGAALLATHYCGQGNVATLAARVGAKELSFTLREARGVDADEGVLVHLTLVRNGDRLRRVETYRKDSRDSVDVIEFVRESSN